MGVQFVALKKEEKYKWLNDYDAYSLKQVLFDVKTAYEMFFEGYCLYPKLKKKKNYHQMFPVRGDRLKIGSNYVRIPSIGRVTCHRHNKSEIIGNGDKNTKLNIYKHYCNARVIFDGCDYWLTFEMEVSHEEGVEPNSCKRFKNNEIWQHKDYSEPIGIDLGCKKNNWIVDSRGNRVDRPDTSKEEQRIKKYKKKLNIKLKANERLGKKANSTIIRNELKEVNETYTKNEEKILKKINKLEKRITNKKKATIHEYACSIIQEKPSSIVMENLDVKAMYNPSNNIIQNQILNKQVKDSMLFTVRSIIEHKAKSNNIPVILADREYPSSQLCSNCHNRYKVGKERTYVCPHCGLVIDRDYNASLNLSYLGYSDYNQYDYIIA